MYLLINKLHECKHTLKVQTHQIRRGMLKVKDPIDFLWRAVRCMMGTARQADGIIHSMWICIITTHPLLYANVAGLQYPIKLLVKWDGTRLPCQNQKSKHQALPNSQHACLMNYSSPEHSGLCCIQICPRRMLCVCTIRPGGISLKITHIG